MSAGYRVNLAVFEGPLDLLLSLIEREELDITRVSLARVADQYLEYLEQMDEMRPELLADFLVIAAKLMLIKSEALLPRPVRAAPEGEADAADDLVEQLKMYRQFKAAAGRLQERHDLGLRTFLRLAPPPKIQARPDLSEVTLVDLLAAARIALDLQSPAPLVGQVVPRRWVTVKGQIELIRNRLSAARQIVFQDLLGQATSRLEIAVTLLAVLELIKLHLVAVHQERLFGTIVIEAAIPSGPG